MSALILAEPHITLKICPDMMLGYLKRPEDTADTFLVDKDGKWLRTGDIAIVDKDGHYFITDRLKELIKYKGSQVAPAELEAVLLECPFVADACVIGELALGPSTGLLDTDGF